MGAKQSSTISSERAILTTLFESILKNDDSVKLKKIKILVPSYDGTLIPFGKEHTIQICNIGVNDYDSVGNEYKFYFNGKTYLQPDITLCQGIKPVYCFMITNKHSIDYHEVIIINHIKTQMMHDVIFFEVDKTWIMNELLGKNPIGEFGHDPNNTNSTTYNKKFRSILAMKYY